MLKQGRKRNKGNKIRSKSCLTESWEELIERDLMWLEVVSPVFFFPNKSDPFVYGLPPLPVLFFNLHMSSLVNYMLKYVWKDVFTPMVNISHII